MLKAMIKRALKKDDETVLITKTLLRLEVGVLINFTVNVVSGMREISLCVIQQKDTSTKSRGNLVEDEALDWLKPRALLKPDNQEDVPEAVSNRIVYIRDKIEKELAD